MYLRQWTLSIILASPKSIIVIKRRLGWAEHIARNREVRTAYTVLVWKSGGKRLLRKIKLKREDNINLNKLNRV
jgi:hypothetical protein